MMKKTALECTTPGLVVEQLHVVSQTRLVFLKFISLSERNGAQVSGSFVLFQSAAD